MPTHTLGWVEPSCGLTRASTAIARADLALAWGYNPAGFLVMAIGVLGVARAVVGSTTSVWPSVSVRCSKHAWCMIGLVFLAFWAHQQSNAEFIINARVGSPLHPGQRTPLRAGSGG